MGMRHLSYFTALKLRHMDSLLRLVEAYKIQRNLQKEL